MNAIPVSLAPAVEQRRIVAKLDALLSRVNACRQRLDKIPKLLARFRQSVLAAACSGRLTEDWRVSHKDVSLFTRTREHLEINATPNMEDLPNSWAVVTLESLCDPARPITYGMLKPGPFVAGGIPLVRIVDIEKGAVGTRELHRISRQLCDQYKRTLLSGGEILISLVGTIGRVARVSSSLSGANIHRNLGLIAPGRSVSSSYLFHALTSRLLQKQIEDMTSGANQPLLNLNQVRILCIPLPPLSEQQEIVRRVDQLFAFADRLEARVETARKRVDALTQSILAKAFRGELVPTEADLARAEGRAYESAAQLLERIARVNAKAAGKPKRKPRKRKPNNINPA